jgi:hypothetical protein
METTDHTNLSQAILTEAVFTILSNIKIPAVWVTSRNVGKTTLLSKIATNALLDDSVSGDIWVISVNPSADQLFFKRILKFIPSSESVRITNSRIEIMSNNNRIINIRSLPKNSTPMFAERTIGYKLDPPKLIVLDEIGLIPEEYLKSISSHIRKEDNHKIKVIAATTPADTDYHNVLKDIFDQYELIRTTSVTL